MQIATPMAEALDRYLDLSSLELKLTAQNMANIDTPGYRTAGFDFAAEMSRSMQSLNQQEPGSSGIGYRAAARACRRICWNGRTGITSRWTARE